MAPILLADDERSAALAAGELIATVALPATGTARRRRRRGRAGAAGRPTTASPKPSRRTARVRRSQPPPVRRDRDQGEPWQADVEARLRVRGAGHRGAAGRRRRGAAGPARSTTPSSGASSAGSSARIRRSSTSSPTCTSRSSSPARWCTARRCRCEPRDVSAAKAAASDAALLAARASLQTHGAIGFTQEHDLSLWLLRVQALRSAWGTPEAHRRRVLEAL